MKSEPTVYSIDDLQREGFSDWEGVRNYQARNYMRDEMKEGDLAFFYHSNAMPSGIAGICRVCKEAHPDLTAFDPKSPYYDPKSKRESPKWMLVEVEFVEKFPQLITLQELKSIEALANFKLLQKGSRLSILPVTKKQFELIKSLSLSLKSDKVFTKTF